MSIVDIYWNSDLKTLFDGDSVTFLLWAILIIVVLRAFGLGRRNKGRGGYVDYGDSDGGGDGGCD